MNIDLSFHRATRWTAAIAAAAALSAGAALAGNPPDAPTTVDVSSGPTTGSVWLKWQAQSDGDNPSTAATRYEIRYRFNNTIASESDWQSAIRIEQPPVNLSPVTPEAPFNFQSMNISGLEPGVTYGFAIKAVDDEGLTSALSNSDSDTATASCAQNAQDGNSVSAFSALPTTMEAGEEETFAMTVTISATGVQTGGKIAVRVPDSWPKPVTGGSPGMPGYTAITDDPGNIAMTVEGQMIVFKVTSGSLPSGEQIGFSYVGESCEPSGTRKFAALSQYSECGVLFPTGREHLVTMQPGPAEFVDFDSYDLTFQTGNINRVDLRVVDFCRNPVTSTNTVPVSVSLLHRSGASYVTDSAAEVSLSADMSSPSTSLVVTVPTGTPTASFYYRLISAANKPDNFILLNHMNILEPTESAVFAANVRVVSSGIQNVSADTGSLAAGQTSIAFSPDGDRSADTAFINFTVPERLPWKVELSSNDFTTVTRRFFGDAQNARVAWDGYTDGAPGVPPSVAAPGLYKARISFGNGAVSDSSLRITLSASGVSGVVKDSTLVPLADVEVEIFGPSNRFARTDASGAFTAYGLRPGDYTVRARKQGFSTVETTKSVGNGVALTGDLIMTRQSTLRLNVTRPAGEDLPEIWGNVRANSLDWSRQEFGTIHFGRGKTRADAGDLFKVVPTSYTTLTLAPAVQYRIKFEIPNLQVADSTATLAANEDRQAYFDLVRSANIGGDVIVLSTANPNGLWVSVEAGPDANLDGIHDSQDPSKRYHGGVWLPPSEDLGRYQIFGVSNGSYTLTATAPGFTPQKRTVVVSNDVDATAHFSTFTVGGQIFGTVTVLGNTTSLAGADGKFSVPINAWSAAEQIGSYRDVRLSTNPASTSSAFTITGLADGVYDLHSHLPGYELVPAGRRTVTVAGSSGTVVLVFQPYTGGLTGNITLPGANTDWNNVRITIESYDRNIPSVEITPSSGSYTASGLGTGYFAFRAVYLTTGYSENRNVQVVNGRTARADVDLSGPTFSISGRVSTAARAPYNSTSYLVTSSTPTNLSDDIIGSTVIAANRIALERVERHGGGPDSGFDPTKFDSRKTSFHFYDSSGSFTIPRLTPGLYKLKLNGEMDNVFFNGQEIAEPVTLVRVATANVTGVALDVIDGYEIAGTIRVADSEFPSGRSAVLRLKDAAGTVIVEQQSALSGATVSFVIPRIPDGDYVLSTEDDDFPKAFSARDIRVTVDGQDPSEVVIDLLKPARIRGKLRVKTSGTLLTTRNYAQLISSGFRIEARANPWFSGGHYNANEPLIDSEGDFTVSVNPGKYDLIFRTEQAVTAQEISQGIKQFVNLQISSLEVTAGQTLDVGVVDLVEGSVLKGTVRDRNAVLLANIPVVALPSGNRRDTEPLIAVTNELGQYTLQGIDSENARFYDVTAAMRDTRGDNRFSTPDGDRYGEVRLTQVDTRANVAVDFVLEPALGVVRGRVVTPDDGALQLPFDEGGGAEPGALVIMNRVGDIPIDNPLGNIEIQAKPDGTFELRGLIPGVYNCWALAGGYGSGFLRNLQVGAGTVDIGTVTLQAGHKLFGSLTTPDGGSPSNDQVDTIVAVRSGFEEVLIGGKTEDAAGNVTGYTISGFQSDKPYTVLAFNDGNDIIVLADGIVVNGLTRRDFTVQGRTPGILTQYSRAADGTVTVQFEFSKALRNSATDLDSNGVADDSDPEGIIRVVSGGSTTTEGLTYGDAWLSSDRRRARVTYTPPAGATRFTLRVAVVFNEQDSSTGENFSSTSDFEYFLGIGKQRQERFSNASGGSVQLDEDPSEFSAGAGTFGEDAEDEVDVVFRVAETASEFSAAAAPGVSGAMAVAESLGLAAYPSEMSGAINKVKTADIDPFSSFYDIFLPAGVSHFFPEGREAQLCLAYDESVADPYALNIYYFNPTTNEYILESENKSVDTENQRICVSLSHASVFTVLASSVPVISGAGYTGELNVLNFPNPFNLKPKIVTLQNPGSATASQTIDGTMIKISVPAAMAGNAELEIFTVTGERVRTINAAMTSGSHNYFEWDGKNDSGAKVASGTYIGRLTIGGGDEKFFKMAVVK